MLFMFSLSAFMFALPLPFFPNDFLLLLAQTFFTFLG